MELRERFIKELDKVWDESKRLVNPHEIYVDLSKELWETKNQLLQEEHISK